MGGLRGAGWWCSARTARDPATEEVSSKTARPRGDSGFRGVGPRKGAMGKERAGTSRKVSADPDPGGRSRPGTFPGWAAPRSPTSPPHLLRSAAAANLHHVGTVPGLPSPRAGLAATLGCGPLGARDPRPGRDGVPRPQASSILRVRPGLGGSFVGLPSPPPAQARRSPQPLPFPATSKTQRHKRHDEKRGKS